MGNWTQLESRTKTFPDPITLPPDRHQALISIESSRFLPSVTMKRLLLPIVLLAITAGVSVLGLWMIVIQESMLIHWMQRPLNGDSLSLDFVGLRKGLFYDFRAERAVLKRSDTALLGVDHFVGRIHFLSLLLARPNLSFRGTVDGGLVDGQIKQSGGKRQILVRFDRLPAQKISFLSALGLNGRGIVTAEFVSDGRLGSLKFSISDANFDQKTAWGVMLPINSFDMARGMITIDEDKISIRSFSLEGRGIYARAKGEIARGVLDLKIELMPDPLLMKERFSSFSLIESYKVSPGYYLIPIKVNLTGMF
jgi:type II secretion system protein N